MNKKIIYHLIFVFIVSFLLKIIVDQIEGLNPVIKAIGDIKFSDLYFSINKKESPSDIYIVDIGHKDPLKSREEIANFITQINTHYKPKVIGVDVYFDEKFKDAAINKRLIEQLSSDNVIRVFKVNQTPTIFPDFSVLPGLDTNTISADGYSFGLGKPTAYPCVRFFKPTLEIENTKYHHISKLIAEKYSKESGQKLSEDMNFENKMMINYNVKFVKNRIDINDSTRYHELKDKIVLIGLNTYKADGLPLYNDDTHFTPKNKNYIGRSVQDSYGVEILGTIISNLIENEYLSYSPLFVRILNWLLSLIIYITLLYLFVYLNESFVFFKVISQTVGVLLLVLVSVGVIEYTNHYIDLSPAIGVMFISAEIVEIVEELLRKFPKYIKSKLSNE